MGGIRRGLEALLATGETLRAEFELNKIIESRAASSNNCQHHNLLDIAQELGATFFVHRNHVYCSIQGMSDSGENYNQAARNTILALLKATAQSRE